MNDPKTSGKLGKVFRDPPTKRNTSKSASGREKKKKKSQICYAFSLFICSTIHNNMFMWKLLLSFS